MMPIHFWKKFFLFFLFLAFSPFNLRGAISIEKSMRCEFVEQSMRIEIPGFPQAFNPSIVPFQDGFLLSFRIIPNPKSSFTSYLGVVRLDADFQVAGPACLLNTREQFETIPSRAEDGRLLYVKDTLYMVYSDNCEPKISKGGFRVYVAEVHETPCGFLLKNKQCLSHFEGQTREKREKNWVPFAYEDHLLLAYSIHPHRILYPAPHSSVCDSLYTTRSSLNWPWGEIRGGTPALRDGEHYLSFFHSSIDMASTESENKTMSHYFIGAYTFSCHPPFELQSISQHPIVGRHFYKGMDYKPYWKLVRVVFPCGFVFQDGWIWLVYGRQDHEIWVAKMNKEKLYSSLCPVHIE